MRPEARSRQAFGRPSSRDWQVFVTWAQAEGWRVPVRELALYRNELADSAFVLRDVDAAPLGFVTVCCQPGGGWIGNLIVDPAKRGAGLGRRLFRHAVISLCERGTGTLWLTASAQGQPLYASHGFRAAGRIERWLGRATGPPPEVAAGAVDVGLYHLVRADAAAWGYSRAGLLSQLARGGRILAAGSTVALLQAGEDPCVLGPWLSADLCPRSNRTVLAMALDACREGAEIAIDIVDGSPVRMLLGAAGFRQAGETVLMVRGDTGPVKFAEILALASLGSMG